MGKRFKFTLKISPNGRGVKTILDPSPLSPSPLLPVSHDFFLYTGPFLCIILPKPKTVSPLT
jgi:hypothetical protein